VSHLLRIVAPHFVAGVVVDESTRMIITAAPILRWSLGKHAGFLVKYCKKKNWSIEVVKFEEGEKHEAPVNT
jgi:hypothetical protein